MMVNRRTFLGMAAGLPVVGALILNNSAVLASDDVPSPNLPTVGEPPKLYVPEKPVILAAEKVSRPILDGGFHVTRWSIDSNIQPIRFSGANEPHYYTPPEYEINISGIATDLAWMPRDLYGRKLRMYLVAEEGF